MVQVALPVQAVRSSRPYPQDPVVLGSLEDRLCHPFLDIQDYPEIHHFPLVLLYLEFQVIQGIRSCLVVHRFLGVQVDQEVLNIIISKSCQILKINYHFYLFQIIQTKPETNLDIVEIDKIVPPPSPPNIHLRHSTHDVACTGFDLEYTPGTLHLHHRSVVVVVHHTQELVHHILLS